jgi:UDP-glucuronate 4-epimerase
MPIEKILVTGAAGFIGHHATLRLAKEGYDVIGIDNLNTYYDVMLKRARLLDAGIALGGQATRPVQSTRFDKLRFQRVDIVDERALGKLFDEENFDAVIHLAAQAGLKYSLDDTKEYIESNASCFLNILEACRHHDIRHLIYASSGSVYGVNTKMPFSELHNEEHPVSLYATTKRWNEEISRTYSSLFGIPTTGLRLFTVYGPWGRPDMTYYTFIRDMLAGKPIEVVHDREMNRYFTYVDDVTRCIESLIPLPPSPEGSGPDQNSDPVNRAAPYRIVDVGNEEAIPLQDFIHALEDHTGVQARLEVKPMQPGYVTGQKPDSHQLQALIGYKPETGLRQGIGRFVQWYRSYYH